MTRVPESHLLPDAVVAFVDAELSLGAHERAAAHLAGCPACAAEVSAQRQARTAVQGAQAPSMSAGFLESLRSIPDETDLSHHYGAPDNLAITDDGQLVAVQRPEKFGAANGSTVLGSAAPLGSSTPLGQTAALRRRTAQSAGVVASGVVLSAIALVVSGGPGGQGSAGGSGGGPPPDVLRAQFVVPSVTTSTPSSSRRPDPATTPGSSTGPVSSPRAPAGMQR